MKCTLCVTLQCNLRCAYCYISKKHSVMSLDTAKRIVDFVFRSSRPDESINFGFFGGEPLLEFDLIRSIVSLVTAHPRFSAESVNFSLVSNGTIFDEQIADFILNHDLSFCVSSDGPPAVHDLARCFSDGTSSAYVVDRTIRRAVEVLPSLLVNSVYTPATLECLPEIVAYHAGRGVRRIFLSPDYSASWPERLLQRIPDIYGRIAERYVASYREGRPVFINLIDNKIAAMLRGGFLPEERCRMGSAELAFGPSGNIYPCERLIGSDDGRAHCIGNIEEGIDISRMSCKMAPTGDTNSECASCGVRLYCMNWCGCSNSFATGWYNRVSPFTCVSEKAAIGAASWAFDSLKDTHGAAFLEHLSGKPFANALRTV